jgi:hypothetical protein
MKVLLPLSALLIASAGVAQELPSASPAISGEAQTNTAQKGKENGFPVKIHGFLLGDLAVRVTGERPPRGEGGDFVLGEGRLRLDISGATRSGKAYFTLKGDMFYDAIADEFGGDLREGYAGYTGGPLDVRVGRQIITWGVGDLFFINDVFPKDWESFFSGRPMEYLKLGIDGARVRYSGNSLNAEFVAVPFFTPDSLPSPRRFFLFDPSDLVPNQHEEKPAARAANAEVALRVYRRVAEFDVSVYAYRGYWRSPGVRLDSLAAPTIATRFYPQLSVYGLSAQRGFFEGVISLETGYYDSRQDRNGNDPAIPNSQWRWLAGYQRELSQDFTAGVQVYGELMSDYRAYRDSLPAGMPRQDKFRGLISTRLNRMLKYQTWMLSLFAAYSPTDSDYFLQPEGSHKLTDNLGVSVGANVFGGKSETTFFGQLSRSDNVFVRVRFDF